VDTLLVPNPVDESRVWTISANRGGRNVMTMMMPVPLTPRQFSGYNPDGGFLVGWSADYQVAVSPNGSDTSSVFGRSWTPQPVTDERREVEVEATLANIGEGYDNAELRKSLNAGDIPATAPAFAALHVDQNGSRWIRLDTGLDTTTTRFDVFNPAGALLGTVAVGSRLPMYGRMAYGSDEIVVARENIDGIPVLARYRVRRP
jgi:hypothetical protein